MKANRNDPCPCGSGKKYKNCHGLKGGTPSPYRNFAIIGVVVVIGVSIWLGRGIVSNNNNPTPTSSRPGGAAPPGKVWSEEHGHWHDAAPGQATAPGQTPAPQQAAPQPPGPAPEGKVWSAEHGHWHDVVEHANPDSTTSPTP